VNSMTTYSDSSTKNYHGPPPSYPTATLHQTQTGVFPSSSTTMYHSVPTAPIDSEGQRNETSSPRSKSIVLITLIIAITIIVMTIIISGTIIFLRHYPGVPPTTTTTTTTPRPICFDGDGFVVQSDGSQKKMRDLRIGDEILVASEIINDQIKFHYSPVIAIDIFQKYDTNAPIHFLEIHTESNLTLQTLRITPQHLLFAKKKADHQSKFYFASDIQPDDYLYSSKHESYFGYETKVVHINRTVLFDAYAPLTLEGSLIVNDIVVSCYGTYSHDLVHWIMLPRRWFLYYNFRAITTPWLLQFTENKMDWVRHYLMMIDIFRLSTRKHLLNIIDLIKYSVHIISLNV